MRNSAPYLRAAACSRSLGVSAGNSCNSSSACRNVIRSGSMGVMRVEFVDLLFDGFHRLVDRFDDPFQEAEVALLGAHRALPVPLIDVERVDVVQFLVGADGVHVGVQPVSRGDLVGPQFHAFPFGQRVHHLGPAFAQIADRERHGALHAVQVVVDARARKDEQRRCDAAQAQAAGQHVGKISLR